VTQAVTAGLFRGLLVMLYACRVIELSVWRYLRRALLPALGSALLPAAGLAALTTWHTPTSWPQLFGFGAVYGFLYLAAMVLLLDIGGMRARLVQLGRGRNPHPKEPSQVAEHKAECPKDKCLVGNEGQDREVPS
jgi:hypothetical protein